MTDRSKPPEHYRIVSPFEDVHCVDVGGIYLEECKTEEQAIILAWAHRDAVLADAVCSPAMLTGMGLGPDGMHIDVEHFGVKALAHSFRESLGSAENYIELRLCSREEPPVWMVVTIQRAGKKTPGELKREADAERDRLAAATATLVAERDAAVRAAVEAYAIAVNHWGSDYDANGLTACMREYAVVAQGEPGTRERHEHMNRWVAAQLLAMARGERPLPAGPRAEREQADGE